MNNFTNNSIEIAQLPKFEEVQLNKLHPDYFKVIIIKRIIFSLVLIIALAAFSYFKSSLFSNQVWLIFGIILFVLIGFSFFYAKICFRNKGFALREHDVIFKSGVISETTTIVTNNRVQHVALHQGLLSRFFGLASIELFTAGGSSSDLKINGLLLDDAKKIKESVSVKIKEIETINTSIASDENNINEKSNEL